MTSSGPAGSAARGTVDAVTRSDRHRFLTPPWVAGHVLVLAAVLVCLRLGWWQWEKSQQTLGDAQNFGYALLWPAFGAAFVYMWVRFLNLEVIKDHEEQAALDELLDESERGMPGERAADGNRGHGGDPDRAGGDEHVSGTTGAPSAASPQDADGRSSTGAHRLDVGSNGDADDRGDPQADTEADAAVWFRSASGRSSRPSRGVTIAVASVGAQDDEDGDQLTEYNRALAALAEEDRRRGR